MESKVSIFGILLILMTNNSMSADYKCFEFSEAESAVVKMLLEKGLIQKHGSKYLVDEEYLLQIKQDLGVEIKESSSDTICR